MSMSAASAHESALDLRSTREASNTHPRARETTLSIAAGITEGYVLPLMVVLASLVERLASTVSPVLYLIHRGLSDRALEALNQLIETRSVLYDGPGLTGLPSHPRLPPEAAVPLVLADVLPADLSRVLFLDADLLVLDDLSKLWAVDLESHVLAAAPDGAIARCGSARGVRHAQAWGCPKEAIYFNAGVLLIDLEAWRQRSVTRRSLAYLQKAPGASGMLHQEALNAILWNDWLRLPQRWNLLASTAGRPFDQSPAADSHNPGIVHFAGRIKPWRGPVGGPFNDVYQATLKRVLHLAPASKPTMRDKLYSLYDRRFRNILYPLERLLWNRRIL